MHDTPDLLSGLNGPQCQAVTHESGPLLILAGAGSGKTRAITHRIAWLVRERSVFPGAILAVTFTNKAAGEMKERVERLLGTDDAPRWIGTFHSICLRMLRKDAARIGFPDGFVVYDDDDQASLLRRILKEMGIEKVGTRPFEAYIDGLKNEGLLEPPPPRTPREQEMARVYGRYREEMTKARALDFGDLLARTLHLLADHADVRERWRANFEHIIVDEFQDTNRAQYELLKLLVGPGRNLCVVGDDDQSIYSWRGARVDNLLDFTHDFPDATIITLGANYRSSAPILEAASHVIGYNRKRRPKSLEAVRGDGLPVAVHAAFSERHEAGFVARQVRRLSGSIPLSRMAVFYRTNAQSRPFEDEFRASRIPYRIVGGIRFYQRKEIKDVLSYLRLLCNPSDDVALERIVNVPPRGIGPATVDKARGLAAQTGDSLLMALAKVGDASGPALKARVQAFVESIGDLALMSRDQPASRVVEETLRRTGYLAMLEADTSPEGINRVENVRELVAAVSDFARESGSASLAEYLDRVALVQPLDAADGETSDALNLMTIHSAKGLEFDVVFVVGLEEELFPHANSLDSAASIEEERRLMYVAMTRARDQLFLTCASTRAGFRGVRPCRRSRFLAELPRDVRVV